MPFPVMHRNKLTHTDLKPENILFVCSDYDAQNEEAVKTCRAVISAVVKQMLEKCVFVC